MRSLVIVFIVICLFFPSISKAQCGINEYIYRFFPTIKFSGVAPRPWAINGQTDDWQTILGPGTGNNLSPYSPPFSSFMNYSFEIIGDFFETPDPKADIKFMAFTYDDYNIYFYLRKLDNSATNFFYFLDINADGMMSSGEPVIGGRTLTGNSNSNSNRLSLYRYIPSQQGADPLINRSYVDGYTMPGSAEKIFDNNKIPSVWALRPHEIFSLKPTENGYGVEFAIPWRYIGLLPGNIFTYRIALQQWTPPGQQGQSEYNPQLVEDNAGSCCSKLLFSGLPDYTITNSRIVSLGNLAYRMEVTIHNIKNIRMGVSLNEVSFNNIQLNPGIPFSPDDFSVTVGGRNPPYRLGTISQQPIRYSFLSEFFGSDDRPFFYIDPFGSTVVNINFSLPANHSVANLSVGASFTDGYSPGFPDYIYCNAFDAGRPVGNRPVILEVTTENKKRPTNIVSETNTQVNSALKVFPNPSNGIATVVIPGDGLKGELRLEDVSGKLIYRKINTTGSTVTLPILKSGFYLLRFIDKGSGKQYIEKLIIQ